MWFDAAQVSVTNGKKVVVVNSSESIANINPADALIVSAFSAVEIARAYTTDQGQFIELVKPWPNATQNTVPAYALPTSGDFNSAVKALKDASQIVHDNYQAMLDWQTKTGTVTFKDLDGNTHVVKTLNQLKSEIELSNPYAKAMNEVEFEAIRQANKAKFKVSGFLSSGKHYKRTGYATENINEGLFCVQADGYQNSLCLGTVESGVYSVGDSETYQAQLIADGNIINLHQNIAGSYTEAMRIKLPPAPNGKKTYDSSNGNVVEHSTPELAFAAETNTNKVILSRVCYAFVELWYEKINYRGVVFPNGDVQYNLASWRGIPLTKTTPQSYSAHDTWDSETHGYSAVWEDLTPEQRDVFLSDTDCKIFKLANGELMQLRRRMRVVEGFDNNVKNLSFDNLLSNYYPFLSTRYIMQQGKQSVPFSSNQPSHAYMSDDTGTYTGQDGTHTGILFGHNTGANASTDYKWLNYLIPVAIITQLNDGVWHPVYNPLGTSRPRNDANNGNTAWFGQTHIASALDCFTTRSTPASTKAFFGNVYGSGRYDDYRFFDVTYAGLVQDMRLMVNKSSNRDLLKQGIQKAIAGELRGRQTLPYTWCGKITIVSTPVFSDGYTKFIGATTTSQIPKKRASQYTPTQKFLAYVKSPVSGNWYELSHVFCEDLGSGTTYLNNKYGDMRSEFAISETTQLEVIISDYEILKAEFDSLPCIGLIGGHAQLSATFPDGVVGQWLPQEPNGATAKYFYPRKAQSVDNRVYTSDSGASWQLATAPLNDVENSLDGHPYASNHVQLVHFTSLSDFTESAINSLNQVEFGDVFCGAHNLLSVGNRLQGSVTGKIGVDNTSNSRGLLPLSFYLLENGGFSLNAFYAPKHGALPLDTPSSNSPAFKTLFSLVEDKGLLYLQFNSVELAFDGTDWGDDGVINIASNVLKTDLNNNLVTVSNHRSIFPIGIA